MRASAEHYLDQFRERKEEGLQALKRGECRVARQNLLAASEALYHLAALSDGKLKQERLASAAQMLESAQRIPETDGAGAHGGGGDDGEKDFRMHEKPDVGFDDIAGLEDVKQLLRLKLLYPYQHPEKAAHYGVPRGGGILLYGPPGTGKTLIARAVAGEIDAAFFTVKPSEILSKWVGDAERNIEALFDAARECPVSVVFVDEIDALAPRRSENTSSVMARVVPQLLAEIEGVGGRGENAMLFLGATNEPWSLDPALLRPGRFDDKVYVGLPDVAACHRVLEIHLAGRPLADDVDLKRLAADLAAGGYSGADIRNVCHKAASDAFLDAVRSGDSTPIQLAQLRRAMTQSPPSVSPAVVERFRQYARGVSGAAAAEAGASASGDGGSPEEA